MSPISKRANFLINRNFLKLFSGRVLLLNSKRNAFSYRDIPRAPSHPFFGSVLHILKRKTIYYQEYIDHLHKKLGSIFVDRIWGTEVVHIADAKAKIQMFKNEGDEPLSYVPEMWKVHSKFRNHKRGLFFMSGKEWREARVHTDSVLRNADLEEHVKNISSITKEFINIWEKNPPKDDLRYYLYCWNVECIGNTALGMRLGFLEKLRYFCKFNFDHVDEDEFVKASCRVFPTSTDLLFKPISLYKTLRLRSWLRYSYAADVELLNGEKYVMKALKGCFQDNSTESTKRSLICRLYDTGELSNHTIRKIFIEIFLASASLTSNAAIWVLYLLGRNPKVAERVRQEISTVMTEELSMDTLIHKLPYLTGVIKESLRLYPTIPFLTRILATDAQLYGFHVPAGSVVMASMYTMGRIPYYFRNPDSFIPDRWLLDNERGINKPGAGMVCNTKAFSPFSMGSKSCPGSHLAFINMQILVIEALKAYDWTTNRVDYIFNLAGVPSKNVDLFLRALPKTE